MVENTGILMTNSEKWENPKAKEMLQRINETIPKDEYHKMESKIVKLHKISHKYMYDMHN